MPRPKKVKLPRLSSTPTEEAAAWEARRQELLGDVYGRAPTEEELRNMAWRYIGEEDVQKFVRGLVEGAIAGQPTAVNAFIRVLGLEAKQAERPKSTAENILESIRGILAAQASMSATAIDRRMLEKSSGDLYDSIIQGQFTYAEPSVGDTVAGEVGGEGAGLQKPSV